jgi:hypothetical protein
MKSKHSGWRHGAGIYAVNPHRRMASLPIHLLHALFAPLARLLGGRPALDPSRSGELSDFRTPVPERGFGGRRDHGRGHGHFGGGHGHGGHGGHGFGERPAWKGQCIKNCPACELPECVHPGGPKSGRGHGGFAQPSPSRQAQPQPPQSQPQFQPWMAASSEQQTSAPQPAQEQPTQQEESCPGDCRSCPNGVCVKTGRLRAVRPKQ